MKKILLSITILIIVNLFYISLAKAENIPTLPKFEEKIETNVYNEGEIIIKYKNQKKKSKSFNKIKEKNPDIELKKEIKNKNTILLKSNKKTTQEMIEELKDDSDIELIEPNYKRTKSFIPSDSYFSSQWSLRNTGQSVNGISGTADADIDAEEAWDIESIASNETIMAVIDDGVDYSHSDLINNMWDGSTCLDDLGDPIIGGCPNHGWDYQDNDNDPYFNEHGTFVSSLIASQTNNSSGIAGLSRYNKIKIMALKFDFDLFTELEAIDFASYNGAKVINASYGGPDYSEIEKIYIESFDGIFVASAGNASNNNDTAPEYPCSYNSQNVICVASSDQNDSLSSFSNYGSASVDITAPGENMIGLYKDSYYIGEGTSFSAPLVAGTTALLYSQNPAASINTISETLLKSSDHLSSLDDNVYCNRRLNAKNALQSLISNITPNETCSNINATLFFDQSEISASVGQTIDLVAKINPGTNEVSAVELDITFDPTILRLDSVTRSSSFNTILSGPTINNTAGTGSFDVGLITEPPTYITETSDIATFSFTTLAAATNSPISFATTSNAAAQGEYVTFLRENSNITIHTNTPLYRLYNTKTGFHVYARGEAERDLNMATWPEFEFTDGRPAFYASLNEQNGLTPIYRIYNTKTGAHVYARGEAERDLNMATWPEFEFTDGRPAFYASLNEQNGLTPIYRIYNTKTGAHVYARGEAERDLNMATWPEFEFTDGRPAFYASLTE